MDHVKQSSLPPLDKKCCNKGLPQMIGLFKQ